MLAFINKQRRAIIMSVALMLVAAAFMAFAIYSARTLVAPDSATPTASEYSERVGHWLPEVQNFQAHGEGWQDWLIEARFDLSEAELSEFLRRNNLVRSDCQRDLKSSYKLEWFSSASALEHYEINPLPGSATSTSTGFYPSVWVDTANPESVIVYIKANDT